MNKLSTIIPVYNEAESLPELFAELYLLEAGLQQRDFATEFIFIDDGSRDGSLSQMLKFKADHAETRIVKLTRNFGAIHATKVGMEQVTGDCFTVLSADLQDPPELILDMIDHWRAGSKFVIYTRQQRQDPLVSRAFAALYYRILRRFVAPRFPVGGFDLALMDGSMLPYMKQSGKNINLALFAFWLGFEPEIMYYTRRKRRFGRPKWTFGKKFTFFIDSILGFSFLPIRLISMIGVIVSLISFTYGAIMVIYTLTGHRDLPGYPTIVSLISFLLGLVIIMLGVIGEYVWRILDEINHRPEAVIDEIYD